MDADTAWKEFSNNRSKKIFEVSQGIYLYLIEDGFGESPSARSSALYRALEVVPECKDEVIFKDGYTAAMVTKGN